MPGRTTRSVLADYLAGQGVIAPGEPPDRWYAGNWLYLRVRNRRVPFFPLVGVRRPTMLHDLNHLLSRFDTTWRGEFSVAGWELASGGCGRFLPFWIDRLLFVAIGLLLAPFPTMRGLRSGSGCRNTYGLDPDTVLEKPFLELQRYARVATSHSRNTPSASGLPPGDGMRGVAVRRSEIGELGVFTLERVRAGEVIREFTLEREITRESPLRPGERPEHCPSIDGRVYLVGAPDRYFNHSCDPNVYLRFEADRIDVVARRDIAAASELTLDYLINNPGGDSWPCHCGASRCRGETGHSFFTLPEERQREYFPLLAPWFLRRYRERLERPGASRS